MDALTIVIGPSAHQSEHAKALSEGAKNCGVKVIRDVSAIKTRHVACWGWRLGKRLRAQGLEVLVMERGYLGDRFRWSSLGWNGLNGRASFPARSEPSRFGVHFGHLMKPWNPAGDYVLLVGQVPGDMSLEGRDLSGWYNRMARMAADKYGLPVVFRPHPLAIERGYRFQVNGTTEGRGPLDAAIRNAAVVITYNSNTGVESVLAGKPTITFDEGSMAYPVTAHSVGESVMPDREAWANRLAWCQWTLDEIKSGEAWEAVCALAP